MLLLNLAFVALICLFVFKAFLFSDGVYFGSKRVKFFFIITITLSRGAQELLKLRLLLGRGVKDGLCLDSIVATQHETTSYLKREAV